MCQSAATPLVKGKAERTRGVPPIWSTGCPGLIEVGAVQIYPLLSASFVSKGLADMSNPGPD